MPARPLHLTLLALLALACLGAGAAIGLALGGGDRAPAPVVREALAQSTHPRGSRDRTLALTRVIVKPGAKLALHHHPGTQIAYIDRGTLTYAVAQGKVRVRKGAADEDPRLVRTIRAGDTARIRTGQWIVEQPTNHHHAANQGKQRVVIYLSTLFPDGAPPSIPG